MKKVEKINSKGFTLIEILVVIGILTVLFAIVIVAINPARQFSLANNTKRKSDVEAVLNGIHQYMADHHGALPAGISWTSETEVNKSGADICASLVTQYIAGLPVDPKTNNGTAITNCSGAYTTRYFVIRSSPDNRITVSAPDAELSDTISVTR
jgi:prepilin-type N-terminal cleavage/methylation domain-containing protein